MTRRKRVSLFGLGMLMLFWALACGGSSATPAAMTDVPVYSGATPMELGDNPMVDTIVDSVEESAGEMGSIETELYTLPAGTSWADVKSFYSAEFADTDWESEPEFTDESETFNSVGWTRGSGAQEQAILVMYVAGILDDGALLVTMLISE